MAVFWLAQHAGANDFIVGGKGADLVPLDEPRVRMQSEDILIVYEERGWKVRAEYVFENLTDEAVVTQVGFPEILCDPGDDCNARFWNLKTQVNGAPVKHRGGKLRRSHDWSKHLGSVWLFDVTFGPGRATRISHRYWMSAGSTVDGQVSTTYVTRTGATWAGSIGRARFTVRLPFEAHRVGDALGRPRAAKDDEGVAVWDLVREETNWVPDGDISVYFFQGTIVPPVLGEDRLERSGVTAEEECVFPPTNDAPQQMCTNLSYAISGHEFQTPRLRKYFYGRKPGWHHQPALWGGKHQDWVRSLQPLSAHGSESSPSPPPSEEAQVSLPKNSDEVAPAPQPSKPPLEQKAASVPEPSPTSPTRSRSCACSAPRPSRSVPYAGLLVLVFVGLGATRRRRAVRSYRANPLH